MVNYQNGKIYRIIPTVEYNESDIYIGSTKTLYLSHRFDCHRREYKRWKLGKITKKQLPFLYLINTESTIVIFNC